MPFTNIGEHNIFYQVFGNGPNALLCLPGFLGTADDDFGPVMEKLDLETFTAVSWDPPGYGLSYPPERQIKREAYHQDAEFAAKLMNKLGLKTFSVLTHSAGGITGVIMVNKYPERVKHLITLGLPALVCRKALRFHKAMQEKLFWPEKLYNLHVERYGEDYFKILRQDMQVMTLDISKNEKGVPREYMDNIKCPLLILQAEEDTIVSVESAHLFAQSVPHAKLHIFRVGGHDVQVTHPNEYLEAVYTFLKENGVEFKVNNKGQ